MSQDTDYELGYRDCREELQPIIDKLQQQKDALEELMKARERVLKDLEEQVNPMFGR